VSLLVREPAESSLIGSIALDRYRVEAELGSGAMGSVYRGRHVKVGRTVAIKVLHSYLLCEPEMVDRFEREARLAAKLKHPNLVAVIDLGTAPDGSKLMVLEYAPGISLAELVSAPLPRERAIALTRQLLHGLEHAHGLGLVHRDLKPENVLVEHTASGADIARIVDFGIAVLRDADESVEGRRLTTSGMVLGTPMYMSPEQARAERVDQRTDLFALGVIVYELLAGKPPFEGSGIEIMMLNMMQDPPSVHTRTGRHVDPLLELFARKLMAREVGDRFQSAIDALHLLDLIERDRDAAAAALGSSSVPDVVEDTPRREPRGKVAMPALRRASTDEIPHTDIQPTRGRWGVALGALAFIVGAALAFTVCT